ncbi:MAG: hypothetical protein LBD30_00650, partial [Verrucomicrobiales bacterium]|nr:hypothetical protein [Verrucomicrobiales bacterium]
MSNDDFNLNLDSLFQPAWAQGSIEQDLLKKFGHHADHPEHSGQDGERHGQRRRDGERRGKRRGTRADNDRRGRDFGRRRDGGGRHGQRVEPRADLRRDESAPLPDVEVEFFPEEKGCEQLAAQIKTSARACPLFKLALLLLDKANCYNVRLTAKKSHQSLFICALDDSPWVKENEAVLHVLKNHLATFYQAERVPVEPPKGVYTFIAQYDGVLLGPPNYHDYQIKLHELHAERFARLPF